MSKKQKIELLKEATIKPTKELGKKGVGFFKNFVLLLGSIGLILIVFKGNEGYSWVWTDLLQENLKFISRSSHLTETQKYQSKFGIDAAAIDLIKRSTPENAVILFPPGGVIMDDSAEYKFQKGLGGIKARNWTLYFLYPRKLVYAEEIGKSPFSQNIDYVVCMNGWGYDKLKYEATPKSSFEILPINENSLDKTIP